MSREQQGPATHRKPWLRWASRLLTLCFFVLVPVLLFMLIKNLEWQEVKQALHDYKISTLALGGLIAMISFLVISSYELLGKKYVGHHLPTSQVMPLGFVCYAFNLNLAWVGGMALRYRLYTRSGLSVKTITQLTSFSIVTNWLGYAIVAGAIFSLRLLNLPEGWKIGATGLQIAGFIMLAIAIAYLLACAFSTKRTWTIRDYEITLPSWRLALLQAGFAAVNWSLMGLIIFILLPKDISYFSVLGVLLISSVAGVITHIPAGLGVIEAVFISMLQGKFSTGSIIAALLAYRALYFLIPLIVAFMIYLVLERRAKKAGRENKARSQLETQ